MSLSQNLPATAALQQVPYVAATSGPLIARAVFGTGVTLTNPGQGVASTGTGAANNPWIIGPFTPHLARAMILTLNATVAASGSAQLLRSVDNGTTQLNLTKDGGIDGTWQFGLGAPAAGVIVNEAVRTETEAAATYFLSLVLTAGTVTLRLSQ